MRENTIETLIFQKGDRIIQEGDTGDCAYAIISGEVDVVKKSFHREDEVFIARLGPDEIVGEMCLFGGNVIRSASVVACSDTVEMIRLPKEQFDKYLENLPEIARKVIHIVLNRLRKTDSHVVLLS